MDPDDHRPLAGSALLEPAISSDRAEDVASVNHNDTQNSCQRVADRVPITFASLPTEVRLLIWRSCLPSRFRGVKQVTAANADHEQEYLRMTISPIAHVCREAREVACQGGGAFFTTSGRWPYRSWQRVWIDPTRDTIYINGFFNQISLNEPGHIMSLTTDAKLLAIYHSYLRHRSGDVFHPDSKATVLAKRVCQLIIVCEDQFTVTTTYERAVESRLFGLWAEERLILVNVSDADKLSAVMRLPCSYSDTEWLQGLPEQLETENKHYTVEDCLSEKRTQAVRHSVEEGWIGCHKHRAKTPDGQIDHSSSIFDGPFVVAHRRSHPWVKEILKGMPKLEIALCFQLRIRAESGAEA